MNNPWTWYELKLMILGPFAASKAFCGGFWWTKSCKLVTGKLTTHLQDFYLKDLTWSVNNNNNMYLGPIVAAQQVLDPSPQTSHSWKEKKGGGGGDTSAVTKSSGV